MAIIEKGNEPLASKPPIAPPQPGSVAVRTPAMQSVLAFVTGHAGAPAGFAFWLAHLAPERGEGSVGWEWAWLQCPRANWMIWLARAAGVSGAIILHAEQRAKAAADRAIPVTRAVKLDHVDRPAVLSDAADAVRAFIPFDVVAKLIELQESAR